MDTQTTEGTSHYGTLDSFLEATTHKRLYGHSIRFASRRDAESGIKVQCGNTVSLGED